MMNNRDSLPYRHVCLQYNLMDALPLKMPHKQALFSSTGSCSNLTELILTKRRGAACSRKPLAVPQHCAVVISAGSQTQQTKMAASSATAAATTESGEGGETTGCLPGGVTIKREPGVEDGDGGPPVFRVVKREPVVELKAAVSGSQPMQWAADHRLAVSTASSASVMELVCDLHSNQQEMVLHRTNIPVPAETLKLKVGPEKQLEKAKESLSLEQDPTLSQSFKAEKVINTFIGNQKGFKYTSWSPLGCDYSSRCLLACLTLDHRLTVYSSQKLRWLQLVDLTGLYSERLEAYGYSHKKNEPSKSNLFEREEMQRRFRMQTPVRMEWSHIYRMKKVLEENTCKEVDMVMLAVLMENGDIVLWRFIVPFAQGGEIDIYTVIESGIPKPSDLAWWESENDDGRMSALVVGSQVGPVKVMPVQACNDTLKKYFTLRQPVVLWKEEDQLPVENLKCVSIYHPIEKRNGNLVLATRGCYVFWCLLMISPAGLKVHNSHVSGLHTLPIVSFAVTEHAMAAYTCSLDGTVRRLTPTFTSSTLIFQRDYVVTADWSPGKPFDFLPGKRLLSISLSQNGAYMAVASTTGMVNNFHMVKKNYNVNIFALQTPEDAAKQILISPKQNLYRYADLLELVRWQILQDKAIPEALLEEVDRKIQEADQPYFWRFKLFLVRMHFQALKGAPVDPRWKPTYEGTKVFIEDEEEEDGAASAQDVASGDVVKEEDPGTPAKQEREGQNENSDQELEEAQALIETIEHHLVKQHVKKVLAEVYLNIWTPVKNSVPICGLLDYLSDSARSDDRNAEVLIGHVRKKMSKQTFTENCSLCGEVLPFTDHKEATCDNGHRWLRCGLSYQACQALTFRRCLLQDSIASMPVPEEPEWIRNLLHWSCTFCDSPMI